MSSTESRSDARDGTKSRRAAAVNTASRQAVSQPSMTAGPACGRGHFIRRSSWGRWGRVGGQKTRPDGLDECKPFATARIALRSWACGLT